MSKSPAILLIVLCGIGLIGEIIISPGIIFATLMTLSDTPDVSEKLHSFEAWRFYLYYGSLIIYPFITIFFTIRSIFLLEEEKHVTAFFLMLIPSIILFPFAKEFFVFLVDSGVFS